nr:hypothetical protein [Brevundimonas diminuta]
MTPTKPALVPLGSARRETRAIDRGDSMELNPLLYYVQTGVRRDLLDLGAAGASTRAVSGGDETELNPIFEWTPAGVR